ncbi:hypothetical protein GOB94_05215 [Granulicella sp. 5B5]|uniref:hypothetical protein n=1 Tax=Granulicella sp. 5B5 TaxID=1617967 RepID=UPI0015F6B7F8|nr:hypothetical protein [Granulicella sp. 5B5]QMV18159.1 hypothetical protein GOB94_05215 [Granulicella sp. 5B5]
MAQTNSGYQVDTTTALYERPAVAIGDAATFAAVKGSIESKFSAANVESFLKSLVRAGLRIREFEAVAKAGKLGPETAAQYAKLPVGDQALVRELYLASLEQVEIMLRDKYFKLYAYY